MLLSDLWFHLAVLGLTTALFWVFFFVTPSPRAPQHRAAIRCIQVAFLTSAVAAFGFVLRFTHELWMSVILTNLFLQAAFYLLYASIRLRFSLRITPPMLWLMVLHTVLFTLVQHALLSVPNNVYIRDLLSFINHSLPLGMAIWHVRQRSSDLSEGDRLLIAAIGAIWAVLLVFYPIIVLVIQPSDMIIVNMTILITIVFQTLVFGGVIMSYIITLFDRLKQEAETDRLTGLNNRHYLYKRASDIVAPETVPVGVILADIDNFKAINDEHGHLVGDQAIKEVALFFKSQLRPQDVVIRFGGEEYLALLQHSNEEQTKQTAERIRAAIAAHQGAVALTVSIGIACCTDEQQLNSALSKADHALYEAKSNGKNRVERFPPR